MKTSVHMISLVFSWIQVRSVFNVVQTIALLGPKIWDLVLLEIKRKKYANVFRNIMTCNYFTAFIDLIWYLI